jgi:hypothetical protein
MRVTFTPMSAYVPGAVRSSPADGYRKLVTALASRAARIGARDPESAAQEAVKRSLAHPLSRAAVEYHFHDAPEPCGPPPEWSLLQLLGWLHGVLRFVVLEEHARSRREVVTGEMPEPMDTAATPLDGLIDAELHAIVQDGLRTLSADHRSALLLRLHGTKYGEIAARLGVNENTVATWIRRGSRTLVDHVRRRMAGAVPARDERKIAGASHG